MTKLTPAQRKVLAAMAAGELIYVHWPHRPSKPGSRIRHIFQRKTLSTQTVRALEQAGYIYLAPRTNMYCITEAGRAALAQE